MRGVVIPEPDIFAEKAKGLELKSHGVTFLSGDISKECLFL